MVSVSKLGLPQLLSVLLGRYFPGLFGLQDEDVRRMFPFLKKGLYRILSESGYAHIQATKPDTVGKISKKTNPLPFLSSEHLSLFTLVVLS